MMIKEKLQEIKAILPPHMLMHYSESDWGCSLYFMTNDGMGYARLYVFPDDEYSVYLDSLSVNENARKIGIGRNLQELREKIGILCGAKQSFLWCKKDSWMHDWYLRRGYTDYKDYEPGYIWMVKDLN